MPKYFEGERPLPAVVVPVYFDEITAENLQRLLTRNDGECVFSIELPGLPSNSLGYIFLVKEIAAGYEIRDINDVVFFRGVDSASLAEIMKHASGVEYNLEVQKEFYRIRNERGLDQ